MNEKLYHCLHDECKFTKKGKRGKYTVRTDSGLRKHHQLVHLHPCCSGDKKCKTGATIRKWKIRKTIEKKSYACKHSDCVEMLTSPSSRSNHQQREHFCKEGCQLCMRNEFREPNGIRAYVTEFSSSSPPSDCNHSNLPTETSSSYFKSEVVPNLFSKPVLSPIRYVGNDFMKNNTVSPPPSDVCVPGLHSLYSTATVSTLDAIIRCLPGATNSQQHFLRELKDSVRDDKDASRLHSMTRDQARMLTGDEKPFNYGSNSGYKLPAISSILNKAML